MIELEVISAHSGFVKGKLTLLTVFSSYSINGESKGLVNINASNYGLTLESSESDIKESALREINKKL